MGVDLFSKLWGSISLPSHLSPSLPSPFPPLLSFPFRPFPSPPFPSPLKHSYGVWGSAVSSPSGVRGRAPTANTFWIHLEHKIASGGSNVTWWWMNAMQSLNGWWTKLTCTVALVFTVFHNRALDTFSEGPNNGGPSLAKFHEGLDPRTLSGSTPMWAMHFVISKITQWGLFILAFSTAVNCLSVPSYLYVAVIIARVYPVHVVNAAQRQMAANLWTKPISLSHKPALGCQLTALTIAILLLLSLIDWLSMVLRLRQHNIGYTADGFYRSGDPTNSIKALKEGG